MKRPIKENYGWHTQQGFDDLESGWMHEGGEEAYLEALEEWTENQIKEIFENQ